MNEEFATELRQKFPYFSADLTEKVLQHGSYAELNGGAEILRKGQYVKVIPLVLEGLIRVYSRFEDRELLLYYIEPAESCIMSFAASLQSAPSEVYADVAERSRTVLLPASEVREWVHQFPHLNELFFNQYNRRYLDLLQTVEQLLFNRMDERLIDYLKDRSRMHPEREYLKLRHRQIADELGTSREVVSRVIKKLERQGLIEQSDYGIKVL